jgi:hypothetical protein
MQLSRRSKLFDSDLFIFETKIDGFEASIIDRNSPITHRKNAAAPADFAPVKLQVSRAKISGLSMQQG